jgi:hypothetical protein
MKPVEVSMEDKPYSILAPLLLLIAVIWVYRDEWSLVWLERMLASLLRF